MKKNKKFDTVKMMREIRDKLVDEYSLNPKKQQQDLMKVQKKYGIKKQNLKFPHREFYINDKSAKEM